MKELLSPAGNMDCLYAAINNGADAIYLSGKNFGARKFAANFTNEELKEAVTYAHLYGVKIYVTVNTIIYNEEVDELLNYIDYLYHIGVDALIMQDIGMISLVRKRYPNFNIHASTQLHNLHNHNNNGIKLLKDLGIKKIVLDRELSLEEINKLDKSIEKEVFIHGALCNSYSGNCLFSSMNGGRSGNRGECVQSCRMPYKLLKNNEYIINESKYLLSTKELNTMTNFKELMDSDIDSFKIEGRMKSPAYVGYVTRLYRKLIDNYYNNKELEITNEEEDNLKILFNRTFTNGYLFNDNIRNINSPNHMGLEIGKVLEVNDRKIKIKLSKDLYQEDGIRFKNNNIGMIANLIYNDKGLLINSAKSGSSIYLDNKINLKNKDMVLKTSSPHLEKEILSIKDKKIPINISIKSNNNKLYIEFNDNDGNRVSSSIEISTAINRPTTKEEIIEKISKLGNTPFTINNIDIDIEDNIFVSMKLLNEQRRLLTELLITERTKVDREDIVNDTKLEYKEEKVDRFEISILARTKEQVEASLKENVDRIYVDEELYSVYKDNSKVYLRLPKVDNHKNYNTNNVLVTQYGDVYKYKDKNIISDYYLNIVNNYSIKYLLDNNVKRVTLSPEVNYNNLDSYIKDKVELIIYGRIELMLLKANILGNNINKEDIYFLEDIHKNRYPVIYKDNLTHILHYKNINYLDNINYYKKIGIKSYRLELYDEDNDIVIELINKIRG